MTTARYDLHTHTTASDGRLPPDELVREAARRGLRALAVTDHDTVAGLDAAAETARAVGVELVSGIEVSASLDDASIHVLGLFIRHREPWLRAFFEAARARRVERIHRIVDKLAAVGVRIDAEEVFAQSTHGTVGRPHVARVLVDRGYVSSLSEAFERYLGQTAPAYVGYERVSVAEAVEVIRRAGGIASLAHPGLLERDELIPEMVGQGLQAIEAYHSEHDEEEKRRYAELAARHGLLVTGGSDFHAPDGGRGTLGCPDLTDDAFEKLRRAAGG